MKYLGREISEETAIELMKEVMGPKRREITGDEYKELLLILTFIDPIYVSNNQRSITEVYCQAGKTYHVHYINLDDDPIIEEVEYDSLER